MQRTARPHISVTCNAQLKAKSLREVCAMDDAAREILKAAIQQSGLLVRA